MVGGGSVGGGGDGGGGGGGGGGAEFGAGAGAGAIAGGAGGGGGCGGSGGSGGGALLYMFPNHKFHALSTIKSADLYHQHPACHCSLQKPSLTPLPKIHVAS